MTNEEKAQEISLQWWSECGWQLQATAYDSAIEAMQWKDKQIDSIMLTTEGCLRSFFESQENTQESIDNFIDALKTQITENLKKL